jgi:hypothetical protein
MKNKTRLEQAKYLLEQMMVNYETDIDSRHPVSEYLPLEYFNKLSEHEMESIQSYAWGFVTDYSRQSKYTKNGLVAISLTTKQLEIVEQLKVLAERNYDKGWDFFVECYGHDELQDFMVCRYSIESPITTKAGAIAKAKYLVNLEKEKELNQGDW